MKTFHLSMAAAMVLLAAIGTACQPHQYTGTILNPPKPLEDFSIPASDGSTFTLSEHKDRTVILYFGYTNCPDICPATLAQLQQVMQKIGPDASAVDVAFVTVDPERDTLDALKAYLAHFNPNFVGLRANDDAQLAALAKEMGIYYAAATPEADATQYPVDHMTTVLVLQKMGLRAVFSNDITAASFASDLQELLKNQ